jgi:hypothetical protein
MHSLLLRLDDLFTAPPPRFAIHLIHQAMASADDFDFGDELCEYLWEHRLEELFAYSKAELHSQLQSKVSDHSNQEHL